MILLPIGHERDGTRRLPWITFGILGLCALAFVLSYPRAVRGEVWGRPLFAGSYALAGIAAAISLVVPNAGSTGSNAGVRPRKGYFGPSPAGPTPVTSQRTSGAALASSNAVSAGFGSSPVTSTNEARGAGAVER